MNKANGQHDPQIASLEEARRRAAQKAKAKQATDLPVGQSRLRDWLIGGIILAMAIGMIVFWIMGLGNSITVVQK
jgi:hypothetical protein